MKNNILTQIFIQINKKKKIDIFELKKIIINNKIKKLNKTALYI